MCSRFTLHKNYNEQTPVKDKERSYLWTNSTKIEKVSKNEWKPLEKPACLFLKFIQVHLWPDFTASNQHIWVYWGFPDRLTHIIRVGFYHSFIYSWYSLEHEFFCYWPFGQLSTEKRLSLSYLPLRAKKSNFLKMLLIASALKSCLT